MNNKFLGTITLQGLCGQKYDFNIYDHNTKFNEVGAVYAVTKRVENSNGDWNHDILYVGISNTLQSRLNNHHKIDDCIRVGANCICVHQDICEQSRLFKENDLIRRYRPYFNEMLKY